MTGAKIVKNPGHPDEVYDDLVTPHIATDVILDLFRSEVYATVFQQRKPHIERYQYCTVILTYERPLLKASFIVNFFHKVCLYVFHYNVNFEVMVVGQAKKSDITIQLEYIEIPKHGR